MDLRSFAKRIKFGQLLPPELKNNGAFTGNTYFDTLGLGALLVLINNGAGDAAVGSTLSTTPPLLEECDTTGGSYTAITGAALAAVISATDDNKQYGIFVDLTKTHKRYIRVQAPTAANATAALLQITALGFPADTLPKSAAEAGLTELIEA